MHAIEAQLLELLGAERVQFVIPVYQRVYSWGEKDCKDLWDDVMRAGKKSEDHFIGSFLYTPEAEETATSIKRKLLIDGQQRMTTISLMLSAYFDYLEEDESRAPFLKDFNVAFLRKSYLFNTEFRGEARYKLILSQDDRATLCAIVSHQPLPQVPSKRIVDNFGYFRDRVYARGFDAEALWRGLNRILIIDTGLNPGSDNAQLIFESMNSKGKPLTPIDLIRNYILMSLSNDEQTRLYDGYWHPIEALFGQKNESEFNAFIWYWLWLKVPARKPLEDEAYDEFKRYCQDEEFEGKPEGLLKELGSYATRYANMFLGKETDSGLRSVFERIASLEVKPIRPLMLALYGLYDDGRLSRDAFLRLCDVIESFLFRRAVCRKSTTGLNNFFAGMYRELETNRDPEQYVKAMLLIHGPNMTAYFPTDEDFAQQLVSRDLYHRFSKTRYYLERIENWRVPKEPVGLEKYQVEHILPQNIDNSPEWQEALGDNWRETHDRLVDTLGNLTLTGYNQELSNRPYKEKLNFPDEGYKASHLYLNRLVARYEKWGEEEITDRASKLAEDAVMIWPYPDIEESVINSWRPKRSRPTSIWTLEEDHPALVPGGSCAELFGELCEAIEGNHPDWERYVKKYYVGFRTGPRKLHLTVEERTSGGGWLVLGLPRHVDDLVDSHCLCEDRATGPGMPTYVALRGPSQISSVIELIDQC